MATRKLKHGEVPYFTACQIARGEISYYFKPPAKIYKKLGLKSSTPLGSDYWKAKEAAIRLYNQLCERRKNFGNPEAAGTISSLWEAYKAEPEYRRVKRNSKRHDERAYSKLCQIKDGKGNPLNTIMLDALNAHAAKAIRYALEDAYGPNEGRKCLVMINMLYRFGLALGVFTRSNPFTGLSIPRPEVIPRIIPQEDQEKLKKKALEIDLPEVALAIELNSWLAQRPGDFLAIRRKDIWKEGEYYFVHITQSKTGKAVSIPIPHYLEPEVLSKPDYITCKKNGRPYKENYFAEIFRKVNIACGTDYQFKLMRHTASTAYKDAGAASNAIQAFTGHKNSLVLERHYLTHTNSLKIKTLEARLKGNKE